jgi:hypothetical protein
MISIDSIQEAAALLAGRMLLTPFTGKSKERKIISFLHIGQKTPRFLSILFLPGILPFCAELGYHYACNKGVFCLNSRKRADKSILIPCVPGIVSPNGTNGTNIR